MELIKPKKLEKGDTVALITLSWAGASVCKDRYLIGKKQLAETFGLNVVETPNALKDEDFIYNNPKERLNDLIWAFKNPNIKAIFTIIGGDDSVRMLQHLKDEDFEIIKKNPKIFVGFSDTTITNFILLKAGLISFYGPTVLFGFAENGGIDNYTKEYFKKALFQNEPIGMIENSKEGWILDKVPWKKEFENHIRKRQEFIDYKFIQGQGHIKGNLIGGCVDVLEFIKGTKIWPCLEFWKNKVLFIETSEDKPSRDLFISWLRNYGAQGILNKLSGIIMGIPGGDIDYNDPDYKNKLNNQMELFQEYEGALIQVCKEFNREDLVIVTQLNIGHTMPMLTIPLGCGIELDADNKRINIIENGVE